MCAVTTTVIAGSCFLGLASKHIYWHIRNRVFFVVITGRTPNGRWASSGGRLGIQNRNVRASIKFILFVNYQYKLFTRKPHRPSMSLLTVTECWPVCVLCLPPFSDLFQAIQWQLQQEKYSSGGIFPQEEHSTKNILVVIMEYDCWQPHRAQTWRQQASPETTTTYSCWIEASIPQNTFNITIITKIY